MKSSLKGSFRVYSRVLCPAKVNLILRVGPRRKDGYHEIATWMHRLTWGDSLSLKVRRSNSTKISLVCVGGAPIAPEKNLVVRAARAFSEAFGVGFEAKIHLTKKIPQGAGLGGGSSDAGVLLNLLVNWLYPRGVSPSVWAKARKVGEKLGADIPFFVGPQMSAWCTGFGEKLQVTETPKLSLVLLFPPEGVPTPWAYGILDEERASGSPLSLQAAWKAQEKFEGWKPGEPLLRLENDFESVVFQQKPRLCWAKAALARVGARAALMSGSGSTLFGVFESDLAARKAEKVLKKRGFSCVATSMSPNSAKADRKVSKSRSRS